MRRDPLDTHVEVCEQGRTVALWVDGYEIRFSASPSEIRDHVDVLRRIMAAAEYAIRLLREPEARQAQTQEPSQNRFPVGPGVMRRPTPPR